MSVLAPTRTIRMATRSDMASIATIERLSSPCPWSANELGAVASTRNVALHVAQVDGQIAGFMLHEFSRDKIRLLNIAVHPDWRRNGIGKSFLDKLKAKLRRIELETRESNLSGQRFFRSQGFLAIGVLREFYLDTDEDAYVFRWITEGGECKGKR